MLLYSPYTILQAASSTTLNQPEKGTRSHIDQIRVNLDPLILIETRKTLRMLGHRARKRETIIARAEYLLSWNMKVISKKNSIVRSASTCTRAIHTRPVHLESRMFKVETPPQSLLRKKRACQTIQASLSEWADSAHGTCSISQSLYSLR